MKADYVFSIQDKTEAELDTLGKARNIDFVKIGNGIYFRDSRVTGRCGYRVYRGPEQRPWWWKEQPKSDRKHIVLGDRDPVFRR